ncbi:MAG: RnfABCDGE type electron transport complex subunit D [Clostridia bacterium]|nr:RnfABCDGE type electron transport complex subunit D [Clostridia bacterium]
MDNSVLLVSPAPHVRASVTTRRIMLDVVIALCPALLAATLIFGYRSLLITALCVAVAVVSEWAFERICKREVTVGDISAVVTGMILGLNLPYNIPLWQAAFGSGVAIIIVKQLFGGIGKNFANPAICARIIMLLSFGGAMSTYAYNDTVTSATPLAELTSGENTTSLIDLFLGKYSGCIGETCALALLIGGVYLIARRVITWHIPVTFIGTVFIFSLLVSGFDAIYALRHVLSGGLILGAVFMATDYTTSPSTAWGKVIFGVGCGFITIVIRLYASYPEGVSFAILFMNILNPYICSLTRKKPFGMIKAKERKAAK